ncbi:MAG: hypothetical protein K0U38_03705, partial [Epsilonproteobacteria bacterium]|nr:hypothetical protein [Campylobacterota bacterium]
MRLLLLSLFLFLSPLVADMNLSGKVNEIISNTFLTPDEDTREERRVRIEQSLKDIEALKNKSSSAEEDNSSELEVEKRAEAEALRIKKIQEQAKLKALNLKRSNLLEELNEVNKYILENNIWSNVYGNYETYKNLEFRL